MSRTALREFIAHHDDRWLFVGAYIGLAVVLSMALSLFWLVAVAGLHFGIECLRQAQFRTGRGEILSHALWEVKLDIALVLLALALALYMELILGVLGLQSAARATAATRAGMRATRVAAWERNIRAFILLADDVAIGASRFLRRAQAAVTGRPAPQRAGLAAAVAVEESRGPRAAAEPAAIGSATGASKAPPAAEPPTDVPAVEAPASWRDRWSFGDRFTVALLAGSVLLIAFAPMVTHHSWGGATVALLEQLHPFPR